MSADKNDHSPESHDTDHLGHEGHNHGSFKSYLIGFVLSVILTAIPFWLVMTGVLLSLPIPLSNYLFGFQLLLFALALIERDGALMLFNWIAALAACLFFGLGSGQLVSHSIDLFQRWTS